MNKSYYRPKEIAEILGYTEAYIYKLRKQEKINFVIFDGLNYVSKKDIENWMDCKLS